MSKYCHSCMPLFGGIKEGYSALTKMALRQMVFEVENTILKRRK